MEWVPSWQSWQWPRRKRWIVLCASVGCRGKSSPPPPPPAAPRPFSTLVTLTWTSSSQPHGPGNILFSGSDEISVVLPVRESCKKKKKKSFTMDAVKKIEKKNPVKGDFRGFYMKWLVTRCCAGVWTRRTRLGRRAVIIVGDKVLKYPVCTEAAPPWDNAGVKDEPVRSSSFTCEVNISLCDTHTHPNHWLLNAWQHSIWQDCFK